MNLDLFEPISVTQKERINTAMVETPPHEPGVYTMYDRKDDVLYVGKAKDLYKRVTSYRYSKSRKVQRMIAHIHRIGYEVCKSETDAILLENVLTRSLRPPFNEVNKKPETYYFISTARIGNKREFRLSMRPMNDYPKCYGCFKGHLRVRRGLGALLKLLYVKDSKIDSAHYLPSQLLKRITPMRYQVNLSKTNAALVDRFLRGSSSAMLEMLEHMVESMEFRDKFTLNFMENELDLLRVFFTVGPERNYLIKKELGLESHLIPQDQLDDLHVLINERMN